MQKVILNSGKVLTVGNNEAHTIIENGGGKLYDGSKPVPAYNTRVMTPSRAKKPKSKSSAKRKRGKSWA